jgi:hypothetical protein
MSFAKYALRKRRMRSVRHQGGIMASDTIACIAAALASLGCWWPGLLLLQEFCSAVEFLSQLLDQLL